MSSDDYGRLIYLVLLGAVIAGYFLVANRDRLGEAARGAMLWVFIFLGVGVTYGLWNDISQAILPRQSVSLESGTIEAPRRSDGHYYLTLMLNDVPVEFVVDTGATQVVLTERDAQRIGIDTNTLAFTGRASTANGEVRTAPIRIEDVAVGDLDDAPLRAWVNEGELNTSLLGMSYLQRFESVQITGNKLLLER